MPAWISNYMLSKMCDEIIDQFPNFNSWSLVMVISSHTLLGMWLGIHAEIRYIIYVSKRGHWYYNCLALY